MTATVATISQYILEHGQRHDRCAPSHLCDGWSGCIRGGSEVIVSTPVGDLRTRLAECLRPCGCVDPCYNLAVVFVYPDPVRPQFAHARRIPATWVRKAD